MSQRTDLFHAWEATQKALGYSQAVRAGDTVYVAGTASLDAEFDALDPGDLPAQMRNMYRRIGETPAQFSLGFGHFVRERPWRSVSGRVCGTIEARASSNLLRPRAAGLFGARILARVRQQDSCDCSKIAIFETIESARDGTFIGSIIGRAGHACPNRATASDDED